MYCKNPTNPTPLPLSADMENMAKFISGISNLQTEMKRKMLLQEQQLYKAQHLRQQRINSLSEQFMQFRQLFCVFSGECKHQWISVYKQLLLIINNIVEIYQIKIEKLQSKIEHQQQTIDKLTHNLTPQAYEGQNQECRNIMQELQQSMYMTNSKKVKISDVIASYQSTVLSSLANNQEPSQDTQIQLDNLPSNKHQESVCQSSHKFFKSNKSQNLKNSIEQLSLTQTLKKLNSRSDAKLLNESLEQKQNNHPSFISSRKLSQFQWSKRSDSRTGRSRMRQPTEASSSASKLSQLRKYLYNRTKM